MEKIGILGSGSVAKALGDGFLKNGYEIKLGTGHPEKLKDWKPSFSGTFSIGSFVEAASFGEVLVLAVKGAAALDLLKEIGDDKLKGKTIIDATNPIANEPPQNNVLKFFTDYNKSLMETFQENFPDTHFVKAFNSIGSPLMVNPSFDGQKPTMFICGNSDKAKKEVTEITEKLGFEVEDMGKQEAARAIEPLCILWCIKGFAENKWDTHAFKLLKK